MSTSKTLSYLLDAVTARALGTAAVGRLIPEISTTAPASRFAVLDQFHRPLLRSDRLLMETSSGLELMRSDEAPQVVAGSASGLLVASIPDERLRLALGDLAPLRSLQPQVTGNAQKTTVTYRDLNGKAHCRARLTHLQTENGASLVIVRLEGLRGYAHSLSDLSAYLKAAGAVPMSVDRLCARLSPEREATLNLRQKAAPISPHRRAFDVAVDLVAAQLPVVRATEAGIIDNLDTEYLHDYRVAMRRIRSVISLFKGVFGAETTLSLKARFSVLMAATGRLRDLDVFLLDREAIYGVVPESLHAGLDEKFDLIAGQRAAERARLVRHLRSAGYAREIATLILMIQERARLDCGTQGDEPIGPYARALVWKRYRRMCARAAMIDPMSGDADVHLLRIDGKKLRYLMEFFAPLFPKEQLHKVIRPLKQLQDCLGTINDCAVQQANLRALMSDAARRKTTTGIDMAQSVGALIAVLHQRQVAEQGKALRLLAEFTHCKVHRQFHALFRARSRMLE